MLRVRFSVNAALLLLLMFITTACNLTSTQDEIQNTQVPATNTAQATTTAISQIPTSAAVTSLPPLTQIPPTSFLPPTQAFVTSTPSFVSVSLLSPIPGSVLAGNVQILGSAVHPNFLQYQLEFGPDPNPSNLWFPIGSAHLTPVLNNLLGIWSTTGNIPDGVYQIRLRVFLRDGAILQTSVGGLSVRNTAPTPIPSSTPNIPRPVAAFTTDVSSGFAPLTVRFTNQSTGVINSYNWNFGDGGQRTNGNPRYTFRTPGVYDVRLTVSGPSGSSNFSRRIVVQGSNPPVANFTMDKSSGPAPLTVQFTDTSSGDITGYTWFFGDGISTTERNPRHEFTAVGEYNVILEVRGRDGSSSRVTRRVSVVNPQVQPPTANFTPKTASGDAPLRVDFKDASTGQIDSYEWNFGDNTTSTDRNPIHQYEQPGTYTVTLRVSNRGGSSTATGTVTVNRPPQAPDASFTANPTSGNAPLTVQFSDTSTGTVTRRGWDFGDGQGSSDQNVTHVYTEPGTYRVILTVAGEGGTSDTAEAVISVNEPPVPPVAAFVAQPTEGSAPLTVEFTNQSSGDNITSRWDFGDGSTSDSQEAILTHEYTTNGEYTVTLTVSGAGGPDSVATQLITVTDALLASFTAAPMTSPPGLQIQFTDTSAGNPTSWQWNFGDNTTSTDQNPSHTYASAGSYTVTLTISDGTNSATASQEVVVSQPPDAPVANFEIASIEGYQVSFVDRSTGDVTAWQWDFGDQSGIFTIEQNPVYTYQAAGTYTVVLTVTGPGGSDDFSASVTISDPVPTETTAPTDTPIPTLEPTEEIPSPVADFTFAANGLNVNFTDTSQGNITAWQWDFGDGVADTNQNPSHTYAAAGNYNATLTATGPGGSNSITKQVTVAEIIPAPTADFMFTVNGLNVNFTDTSQGNITAWLWDFGDGVADTNQNPSHTYAAAGNYNVTLTVTGPGGSNSITKPVAVAEIIPAPTADFMFTVNGLNVNFTDTSQGNITAWLWDFGDGVADTNQNPSHTYAASGNYNVTLTVTGPGGSNSTTKQVSIADIVAPPEANFQAAAINGLEVTFQDLSTGQPTAWQWDFGDQSGVITVEQNPVYTYQAPGTYDVTLTVTNAGGSSSITIPVTLEDQQPTEEPQPDESIADTTEILPDIDAIANDLRSIYQRGGQRADVFAVVGGREISQETFLRPFGDGEYTLAENGENVRGIIEWYSGTPAFGGENSFLRTGAAVNDVLIDLLANDSATGADCQSGETALTCELRLTQPAVVIIGIGFVDGRQNTDPERFRANLQSMVDAAVNNGTIPVLMTPYPRAENADQLRRISEVIIEVANDNNVPVLNTWRLFNELPGTGLAENAPSVAPGGADVLNNSTTLEFGENARVYYLLRLLADIRDNVLN